MNIANPVQISAATADNAETLAKLIDIAGEGIPSWLWRRAATDGQSPLAVGAERARRDNGGFSFHNASVIRCDGRIAGMVLGYPIREAPDDDPETLPAPIAPFVALEKQSVGTWYVNALALFPEFQGKGLGSQLLEHAETLARRDGCAEMSIQVYAQNYGAHRLYTRKGYVFSARLPVRDHPCPPYYTGNVELLKKSVR